MISGKCSLVRQGYNGDTEMANMFSKFKPDDLVVVVVMKATKFKSQQQNRLFHELLRCYWLSGCSSFKEPNDLRNHYKKQAGLITTDKATIEGFTIIKETHKSWSSVKRKDATIAIKQLIDDMYESGVNTKDFQDVMKGLGEYV